MILNQKTAKTLTNTYKKNSKQKCINRQFPTLSITQAGDSDLFYRLYTELTPQIKVLKVNFNE